MAVARFQSSDLVRAGKSVPITQELVQLRQGLAKKVQLAERPHFSMHLCNSACATAIASTARYNLYPRQGAGSKMDLSELKREVETLEERLAKVSEYL